jgi:hypothetical protein
LKIMECTVQVLAPIVVNGAIVTSGEVTLSEAEADEHDKAGRVAIMTRNGQPEQWAGCCDSHVIA